MCFYHIRIKHVNNEETTTDEIRGYKDNGKSTRSLSFPFLDVASGLGVSLRFYTLEVSVITKGIQSRIDT